MANCPGYHGLNKFSTTHRGYTCDACSKKMGIYQEMYGCRSCNYDLCRTCYETKNQAKAAPASSPKLEALFAKNYADKEEPEIMSEEGMLKFFKDCGVNAESYETLIIAYHINASEMGIYDKAEFSSGFAQSGCSSKKEIKDVVQRKIRSVEGSTSEFKKFYKWVFHHVKEDEKKKTIATEMALQLWPLVFSKHKHSMKLFAKWLEFCEANKGKDLQVISKDVWELIFDFLRDTQSVDNYDDCGGAWPVAVDEFVEWMQENQK